MSVAQVRRDRMAGRLIGAGLAFLIAVALLIAAPSGHAQMGKKGSHAAPSGEEKPRVDEKAYNAALKRIPDPKKPYDPWSQVHDPEPAAKPAPGNKPN
jgi:hypothetical protein